MYIDAHCDSAARDIGIKSLKKMPAFHLDYERLAGQIGVQFFAFFFDEKKFGESLPGQINCSMNWLRADMERNDDLIMPLLWREQLENPSQTFGLMGIEGGAFINGSMRILDAFFQQGMRFLGLTWNYTNCIGGGALEEGGLTEFGREVVARCEELGIIVDAAHFNRQSFGDLLQTVQKPFIVSHTCCDAVHPHLRNLTDEQLRCLADKGGVAGITFARKFIGGAEDMEMLGRHIAHAVNVAGIEHVGIGSDFDGTDLVYGIEGMQDWQKLDALLENQGFKSSAREKILGDNFLRILQEILPEEK